MLLAHEIIKDKINYPLHIGLTEAGTINKGSIRSAAGLGALLAMGVGDTVRVSLSGDPIPEVAIAREVLDAMGLRRFGARVISCPTCGRTESDIESLALKTEEMLKDVNKPITAAVMGCVVNGPGEAREADIGIAMGQSGAVMFKNGVVYKRLSLDEAEHVFLEELGSFI